MSLDISRPGAKRDVLQVSAHPSVNVTEARDQAVPDCELRSMSDRDLRSRDALALWLRWNEAYQRSTEMLYAGNQSPEQIELLMDQMDQLRQQAVKMSRELLE